MKHSNGLDSSPAQIAAAGVVLMLTDFDTDAGGVSSFPSFLNRFFPEVLGGKSSNAYCTYNSQKLQMFTSCYFLAGKLTDICCATTSLQHVKIAHTSACLLYHHFANAAMASTPVNHSNYLQQLV